ncbi:MAG: nicotinate (nicotinamide) nucleotide adenylyltransferase [Fimbriiglobus sp.]
MARIGLFGGAFDPVHVGHLILAERCREEAKLDEVWFVPSYKPPHKTERQMSRFDARVEMTTLAITAQPVFRVSEIERELPSPSYTVSTVMELKAQHPEHQYSLIVGADSLVDLPGWYHPQELVQEVELIVVPRPGNEVMSADRLAALLQVNEVRLTVVPCPLMEIASRDLRRRVQENRSIRYLVPRAVEEYIREKKLYVG